MQYAREMVVEGLKPWLRKLAQLRSPRARAVRRKAMMDASSPLLKTTKALVLRETGLLARSLGRRVRSYRGGAVVVVIIGPRSGFKQEVQRRRGVTLSNPTKYAHLTEKKAHWLERSEEQTREQVISNLKDSLARGIEQESSQ